MNDALAGRMPSQSESFDQLQGSAGDESRRVLLHGGTILSMDPAVGDFVRGDILLEGSQITDVGADLSAAAADGQAIVVDLEGAIAIPGMHDTHRHSWQGQLRRLIPDDDLAGYVAVTHVLMGPLYRPEDMYIGNLISALGAIDSGVTCVMDFSHNARSAAHSDAAVRAWADSGMRAVHASCGPLVGKWDHQWPADLARLQREHFSDPDGLLTLRMGVLTPAVPEIGEPIAATVKGLEGARELGLATSIDGFFGSVASSFVEDLAAADLLGEDITYIHCQDISEDSWRRIADSGGTVSLAPTSDAQVGLAGSITPVQKALDYAIRPSIGVDVECCLTTDMFSQMQAVLTVQRMMAHNRSFLGDADAPAPIAARDVLDFATVQGARANGLLQKCGTLTPGKAADIVIIRTDTVNTLPLNNAVGTVVLGTDSRNVDAVFIAGKPRKWAGRLVDHDINAVREQVIASRDYLVAASGYNLDILA